MRKHLVKLAVCGFMLIIGSSLAQAQTVYVTETGKKFHKKNCSVAAEGKKGMELKDAQSKGYTACGRCQPADAPAEGAKKQTAAEPKKK